MSYSVLHYLKLRFSHNDFSHEQYNEKLETSVKYWKKVKVFKFFG